ncbi:MAG: DUF1156 domain-containing protein [Acidimicrobiales bacterium]
MTEPTYPKKLIEVALPLDAINREAAREKSIRHGHPSTLHLWWARRPLAACRAVLFAQLVDDPSAHPEEFPTEEAQEKERQRLFGIIERLVKWENSTNEDVLEEARAEIRKSCGDDPPPILDPFAGGGSIPLEAQRLGLKAYASDLNPVAVLINKALIEIPPKWADQPPVHPRDEGRLDTQTWKGAQGLAEDVRYYGQWMRDKAERLIGHLYPKVTLPDGSKATVIAWIWARTVTCPNPACGSTMPLLNSYALSKRRGREAWLRPVLSDPGNPVTFEIVSGPGCPSGGTVTRSGATCLACGSVAKLPYVRAEAKSGRMGRQLLCTIAEGNRRRVYLDPDRSQEDASAVARPDDAPSTELAHNPRAITAPNYGITEHWQLFTDRQLVLLDTFCNLVGAARESVVADGGNPEYAGAVATYLGLSIGRLANRSSSQSFWNPNRDTVEQVFARNALPMIWVYAEANPFSESSGNYLGQVDYLVGALRNVPACCQGRADQADAAHPPDRGSVVIATDPPYYDNVPYADLSDFFYVWLRRCLRDVHPDLFTTLLVPKNEELIAEPARQGSWHAAAAFFEDGLQRAFLAIRESSVPGMPFTVFYAFKQSETDGGDGSTASTGWETMLQGLLNAGCTVTSTWPVRTEQSGGLREHGRGALASSIVLTCRARSASAGITDRRGFIEALRADLPRALREMQQGSVAPVDLAQAAIGPGMAVFSRFVRVLEPSGEAMRVRAALALINQVLDEVLAEQEGDFDPETRWAIKWFSQHGFDAGPFGDAETLCKATGTAVNGMQRSGILDSKAGKVWLIERAGLPPEWDPATDDRVPVWEATQHLVKALDEGGEAAAADLLARLGGVGETARDLAYRLYAICDQKKWAKEAGAYNALVTSWPEIKRKAGEGPTGQGSLL